MNSSIKKAWQEIKAFIQYVNDQYESKNPYIEEEYAKYQYKDRYK